MRRLLIPVAVLIVAVAVWLIQSNYEKKRISGITIENFLELDAAQVNRMIIAMPGDRLEFVKEEPVWYLKNGPIPQLADMVVMTNVLKTAVSISVGQPFSDNPQQQSLFGVDSARGILAKFFDGDKLLADIIIGKLTSDNTHTYLRKPGSNQVYTSDKILTFAFNRPRNLWLDKTIFALNPNEVQSVEITHPDKTIRLSLSGGQWYVAKEPYADSIAADSGKVTGFLHKLCFLRGNDFANISDNGLVNFNSPSIKLVVSMADGSTQRAEFAEVIDKEIGRYYCRRPDRQDTLVVSMPIFESINEDFSDFMPQ